MIAAMRPDIDNVDEYVRNTTARAFAVVAQALGVQSLLPFLEGGVPNLTLVPIRPRWRGERRFLKDFSPGASLSAHPSLSIPAIDAFQLRF